MRQSSKSLTSNNFETEKKNSNNSIIINRTNTRSFSANDSSIPKNFVPILKPKDKSFGDEEDIVPFSLYLSNNNDINDEKDTLDSFSSIDFSSDDENDIVIIKNPELNDNNKKICINTILSKLKQKNNC